MIYRSVETDKLYQLVTAAAKLHLANDDRDAAVIYRGEDGTWHVLPHSEFFDGRFVAMTYRGS